MKGIAIITLLFFSQISYSQIRFQHLIGGPDHERAQTAINSFDDGYIINGATLSFGIGDVDAMLVKTDSTGQIIWSYTYGTPEYDNSEYSIETFDHNIVCAGRSNLQSGFPTSALIFKTDSAGNLNWAKAFGGGGNDGFIHVIETSDQGYAAVGYSAGISAGSADVLFVKTDINGDTTFTRVYGTAEAEEGTDLVQLPDGGYIIVGRQKTFPSGIPRADGIMLRINGFGDLMWAKQYGDSLWEEFSGVQFTSDSGYIVSGSTTTFGAGGFDILLVKTDSSGNVAWAKTFGGEESDACYDVHIANDSSYILSGITESLGYGHDNGIDSTNVFLMKTDINGGLEWMHTYGDGLQDEAFRSALAKDGGFLLTGFSRNYLFNDSTQMFFIKTDPAGFTGCHEEVVTPVDSQISLPFNPIVFNQAGGLPFSSPVLIRSSIIPSNDDACLFASVKNYAVIKSDISVYPNPASNQLTIKLSDNFSPSAAITLNDISGRQLKSFTMNKSLTISIDDIPSGIYFLSVRTEFQSGNFKFLIKH